jgi:hypothetical protein
MISGLVPTTVITLSFFIGVLPRADSFFGFDVLASDESLDEAQLH